MKNIIILGTGQVGRAMALDLCRDFSVLATDRDEKALFKLEAVKNLEKELLDVKDGGNLQKIVEPFDLVINAVPGTIGFATFKSIIELGKPLVDIAFFEQDPFAMHEIAVERGIPAFVDCGVAPGMSHILLGYWTQYMDVDDYICYVGGLPKKRRWPYEYKAPFSPVDVLEEYIRPARYVVNHQIVTKPALSDPELVDIDPVGTLEAFNTDGLRTLLKNQLAPNMIEKTLRYPGHRQLMQILRDSGFLNKNKIRIKEQSIRPIDLTSRLLFEQWYLDDTEEEFTAMQVLMRGSHNGRKRQIRYDLFDTFHSETKTSSMARTTGYTATAIARLYLQNRLDQTGVIPPESIIRNKADFEYLMQLFEEREIYYHFSQREDG